MPNISVSGVNSSQSTTAAKKPKDLYDDKGNDNYPI